MEALAAAPRRAKRRKPEASSEQEGGANISSLVPTTSAPESNPPSPGAGGDESHIQDPPPGAGGEEDGVDRISLLPDAILGEVISLLPTKDAARTRILATRWRHLWSSAPLNLDGGDLRTIDVVSRILSSHRGPGRRFRFPAQRLSYHPATVDAWLRSSALDNLQEIDCWIPFIWGPQELQPPPLPASAFRFSSCLCVATLSQCHLSDDVAQALQFPKLKKLALQSVRISEDSLHSIIAASPVLECLLLSTIFGFHCVRINSASLTSIGVGHADDGYQTSATFLEKFIIEDAPCLKRILYHRPPQTGMPLQVSVISAPNLETLGCLNYTDYSMRLLADTCFMQPYDMMEFRIINSTTPARTVKILAVNTFILSLDEIIDFMRCFPCLEKLYIQAYRGGDQNLWRRKNDNLIKCLDIRLKTVVLNNYRGIKSQVNFATFFVLNAKMLESMTFECQRDSVTDRFLAEQHLLLQLEKRVSRCARVYFTTKRCEHDFMHINHVHDLSKTDPFECDEKGAGVCASFE
ncbi:FBD-associated F-box protein At5g60610-like [Miscanthus floridulus]|uniref:FBD-associated F-box protein At5g60610-like n=1 Tax=Miscanthus floridulus TaxID=154761 RepID=UPI003457F6BB